MLIYDTILREAHYIFPLCESVQTKGACIDISVTVTVHTRNSSYSDMHGQLFAFPATIFVLFLSSVGGYVSLPLVCVFLYTRFKV